MLFDLSSCHLIVVTLSTILSKVSSEHLYPHNTGLVKRVGLNGTLPNDDLLSNSSSDNTLSNSSSDGNRYNLPSNSSSSGNSSFPESPFGPTNNTTGGPGTKDVASKASVSKYWIDMLEKALNATLGSLPGLTGLADEISQLVDQASTGGGELDPGENSTTAVGFNATANATAEASGEAEMAGHYANGTACEADAYVTLSATSLSTLSGLFVATKQVEETMSSDKSTKTTTLCEKIKACISFSMIAVIKIVATPEVTECQVAPVETVFSARIEANLTLIGEMIAELKQNANGTSSLGVNGTLGLDANATAEANLTQTIGKPRRKPCLAGGGGNNTNDGFGNFSSPMDLSVGNGTQNSNSSSNDTGDPLAKRNLPDNFTSSPDNLTSPYNSTSDFTTLPTNTTTKYGPNSDEECDPNPTSPTDGPGHSKPDKKALKHLEDTYHASLPPARGVVHSNPKKGPGGVHLGNSADTAVKVNVASYINVQSSVIYNFITNVNGGSGARTDPDDHTPPNTDSYPGGGGDGSMYPGGGGNGSSYPGGGGNGSSYPGGGGNESSYPGGGGNGSSYPGSESGEDGYPGGSKPSNSSSPNHPKTIGGGGSDGMTSPSGSEYPGDSGPGGKGGPDKSSISSPTGDGYPGGGGPGKGGPGGGGSDGLGGGGSGDGLGGGGSDLGGGGPGGKSGSGSDKCTCPPSSVDKETHLRIRNLESQLASVHRMMRKRGLSDL